MGMVEELHSCVMIPFQAIQSLDLLFIEINTNIDTVSGASGPGESTKQLYSILHAFITDFSPPILG